VSRSWYAIVHNDGEVVIDLGQIFLIKYKVRRETRFGHITDYFPD